MTYTLIKNRIFFCSVVISLLWDEFFLYCFFYCTATSNKGILFSQLFSGLLIHSRIVLLFHDCNQHLDLNLHLQSIWSHSNCPNFPFCQQPLQFLNQMWYEIWICKMCLVFFNLISQWWICFICFTYDRQIAGKSWKKMYCGISEELVCVTWLRGLVLKVNFNSGAD